jgi:SAM-dependent methyltransferase
MTDGYLLAGQRSELERLQLQAQVWEPAGARLLDEIGAGTGLRAVDIGCGAMGWLRLLSQWVGRSGQVIGTDIDDTLLAAARSWAGELGLSNVELVDDDLFDSRLEPGSFDLVHARFELAPLGRAAEQLAAYRRLLLPGGTLVIEEPDSGSWHLNPPAEATHRLIELIRRAFTAAGGDFDAGRTLPAVFDGLGVRPAVSAVVLALPPGHPYLRVPIQFSVSLESRLTELVPPAEFADLRVRAEAELSDPHRWGTTFTLIQATATIPGDVTDGR